MKAFASDYLKPDIDLNKRLRLGTIAQYAPDAKVKEARNEAVIIASADVPGFTQGGRLENIAELGKAFHKRAEVASDLPHGQPRSGPGRFPGARVHVHAEQELHPRGNERCPDGRER